MSDPSIDRRAESRLELDRLIKLLKQAGIAQNSIARGAGYSAGYLTQLLGEKYSVEKLGPSTLARLVRSASRHARTARAVLGPEDALEMDRLLAALSVAYASASVEVYGMDGEILDHREAAQYQSTEADRRLLEDINSHESYGVVQVSGAPGQGKSWTLANLARDAATTHEVVWVDFERLEREPDRERPAHLQMGRDLRRAQLRIFWALERILELPDGDIGDPAAVVSVIGEKLKRLQGVTDERVVATIAGLRRLIDRERLAGFPRKANTRRYIDSIPDVDAPDEPPYAEYSEDDLAEDLCLLWCLADANALVEAVSDGPAIHQPRKLLVLVDSPDRRSEISALLQLLRTIASLTKTYPECRRVLVVISKTQSGARSATSSSTVRRWYPLEPFTRDDLRRMIQVLSEDGWFRGMAQWSDDVRDVLVDRCESLCGLNRRASCMYLDQCHRASSVIEVAQYLGSDEDADDRVPKWIEAWAQRVVHALEINQASHGAVASPEEMRTWLMDGGPAVAPADETLLSFLESFGVVVDAVDHGDDSGALELRVPELQKLVCARVRWLLELTHEDAPA